MMLNIVLLTFAVVTFAAGFKVGAKFQTAAAMIDAGKAWIRSKV